MRRSALILGGITFAAACGADDRTRASSTPLVRGEPAVEIGRLDGPPAYVFGGISSLVADPGGRILVADAQADEIRVFSPDGEFLFLAARRGSGPGEVRRPCCLAFGPDGELWVRDGGNGRYQTYALSDAGAVARTVIPIAHGSGGLWAPMTFDTAGNLIDVGHRASADGSAQLGRFYRDRVTGAIVREELVPEPSADSVGVTTVDRRLPGGQMIRMYLYQPFGSVPLVAHGPGGHWAVAASGAYAIRWVFPGGERLIRQEGLGPALSPAERERAAERLQAEARRAGVAPGSLPFSIPDRKPPLRALWFDLAGRLWVELSQPAATVRLAHVYGSDGTLMERATWPAEIDLTGGSVGERAALGIGRDSLGVERVVRLVWTR